LQSGIVSFGTFLQHLHTLHVLMMINILKRDQ
jgi:hypothetical protein